MDSMRNLSTSLPPSGRRRTDQPELLSEFKAAALSVTNLFKAASSAQEKSRLNGYQDALDDLLAFLDKENLGLMDGEGWKVRQWATERLDDSPHRQAGSDQDDEEGVKEEEDVSTKSLSAETQRKTAGLPTAPSLPNEESPQHRRVHSEPPSVQETPEVTAPHRPIAPLQTQEFTFRATHPYPTNHDRESTMELDSEASSPPHSSPANGTEMIRAVPRSARSRPNNHGRQREPKPMNFNLGTGAGSKRKIPYPDFFDISGMNFEGSQDGRGSRGGKRGRHV